MKAPDKIFFPNDINLLTKLSLVIKQKDDVCYIHKDVLLEWAKKELENAEVTDFDEFGRGEVIAYRRIVDKLNSM